MKIYFENNFIDKKERFLQNQQIKIELLSNNITKLKL